MKKTESRNDLERNVVANLPFVDYTIDHSKLLEGAQFIISQIKPYWPKEQTKFKQFHGGMTNKLMLCYLDGTEEKALVRVYGHKTEYLIDREQEMVNICSLKKNNIGPEVFGRFQNGYCYGYLQGEPLDVEMMRDAHISRLTARKLASWHQTHIPGDTTPMLFNTLEKWMSIIPESFEDNPTKDKKYKEKFSLPQIRQELQQLRTVLEGLNSPIVFSHNDLLCKNVLFHAESDAVHFIDYEYANYSYRGFDIGNHFCEFAGMDDPVDYGRYPGRAFQMVWLRQYIAGAQGITDAEVTEQQVEAMYREVNKFALAAHFYWGSWALVQARFSDIDFDYLDYALLRFAEYFRRKDEFLAL
ncbi:choline/ethanolamine kinase [Capsaspora owczarzaki ATCC 30864]|uniref:ethanolamine kinase n=1 Tax=Capsaspora owczarzaki (strain ATCC 30864) TaxID=595528 RepID=A0A0D2VNA7_CAPO3|nr:choline/ethanolamine kinase [Capsaspora owczarzaki ATCC 30864]KJE91772.1 choline/ethanolamine kinase [Capsaspora owczarzaki ATCC 30864]|eukprot:XP_004363700.1 choline/ethanolamine kinase [Capsaspora owczarzaki ATCC 30864]